jgi:serine protease Do
MTRLARSAAAAHGSFVRASLATAVLATTAGTLLLGAAAPASATGQAAPTGSAAAGGPGNAEKSIVLVGIDWTGYVEYPTTDGQWLWSDAVEVQTSCTGWFASEEGHIVTAGHCVDPAEVEDDILHQFLVDNDALDLEATAADWQVAGWETGSPDRNAVRVVQPAAVDGAVIDDPVTVQVLDWQGFQDGDLALLKASGLGKPTPPLPVATEQASVGDPVTAIGYPANVGSISDFSRLRASFKSGTVSSSQVSEAGVPGLEINADLSAGMSGGPTVDADGRVLGVNSASFVDQSFNFITDTEALRSFLGEHDVEMTTAAGTGQGQGLPEPTSASGRAGRTPQWPLLVGGGVVLLGLTAGGAYQLARRRRSPVTAPVAAPAAPAPVTVPAAAEHTEATRRVGRPLLVGAPTAGSPACSHLGNAPGAHFCSDCGAPLTM